MTTSPSNSLPEQARRYLENCRELTGLCRQNGWIDNETLRIEVLTRDRRDILALVSFEEVIMEGAGCIAGRLPCGGRVHLRLAADGEVEHVVLV